MSGILKGVNKTAVVEIAFGIALGIMIINLLASVFSRGIGGRMFGAEDADNAEDFENMSDAEYAEYLDGLDDADYEEHLENFGGRGRARRASRKRKRHNRKRRRLQAQQDDDAAQEQQEDQSYDDPVNDDDGGDEGFEQFDGMSNAEIAEYFDQAA